MNREEIESYLQELGNELEQRKFKDPVRILVVGGGYMLIMVGNRPATQDVDVVLMNLNSMTRSPLAAETQAFRAAIKAIARRRGLKQNWLNDDAALFVETFAPDPEATLWKTFCKLEVFLPSKQCILALKIISFREKDRLDVEALCTHLNIHTREQAQSIVNSFVPTQAQEDYRLDDTLDELFFEEEE